MSLASRGRPYFVTSPPKVASGAFWSVLSDCRLEVYPQVPVILGSYPRANRTHIKPANTGKPNTHTPTNTGKPNTHTSSKTSS